ncbi:MAG TPA: LysR family transcriptional regulator [Thermoleophilaceae bacterium]
MLDVRRMRVLREVAQQGSFSAAAEALSFTQSAVSQHVAALERETGTQLVDRGPRGVRLTDAGRALVSHADAIIARIDDAEEELAAIAGLREGRLRLASFQSAGATLVPQAVAAFRDRHPGVELAMIQAEPEEATERLGAGDIDLALLYDYEPIRSMLDGELELTRLLEDPYDIILPAGHRLAERKTLKLRDLAGESWISSTVGNGCRRIHERACEDAGFEPKVAFESDDTLAVQSLVAAGVGVTMLPRLALSTVHPGVVVRELPRGSLARRIWAARLKSAYRSPACEAMLQILGDVAEEFDGFKLAAA